MRFGWDAPSPLAHGPGQQSGLQDTTGAGHWATALVMGKHSGDQNSAIARKIALPEIVQ